MAQTADRLLRTPEVEARCALHRATLYRRIKAGTFPEPVQVGPRRVAWRERDVVAWQDSLRVGVKAIA